ncbi:MAG: PDZ domain-containing protein [Gemmatimonadales bacterium]|nr:PDZ domain-containing protein [Gemmatimonadales bacterium]
MSVRIFAVLTLTAVSALPCALAAQEPRGGGGSGGRVQTGPRIYLSPDNAELESQFRALAQRRARLGVNVDMRASDNDSVGATLESVTPGGPASKAGLRSGDIITRLNGKSLTEKDKTTGEADESLPGLRLVEFAAQLKPGDTVAVEFRRGPIKRTVSLVTGNDAVLAMGRLPNGTILRAGPQGNVLERMPFESGVPGNVIRERTPNGFSYSFTMGGPLMELELAPLNADLGQYFGATDGALVIDVPADSPLGLKGGDVILSVDGRKVTSPSSLLRILRSYELGDSFKFEIMRNKARTTVTGKLEKNREE